MNINKKIWKIGDEVNTTELNRIENNISQLAEHIEEDSGNSNVTITKPASFKGLQVGEYFPREFSYKDLSDPYARSVVYELAEGESSNPILKLWFDPVEGWGTWDGPSLGTIFDYNDNREGTISLSRAIATLRILSIDRNSLGTSEVGTVTPETAITIQEAYIELKNEIKEVRNDIETAKKELTELIYKTIDNKINEALEGDY